MGGVDPITRNKTPKNMGFHETHFLEVSKDPIGGINVASNFLFGTNLDFRNHQPEAAEQSIEH